ncbi:MAG: Ankyrin repeat domain protein [candidate division TM6 bacterium GW2011_GWE2_42_60]|nr:MAG: Ankyrin repeat domain protein [candidate division TM6 bacterium GW2011_GWE2_42_60]
MIKSQAYKILARLGLFFILGFYSSLHPNALTDAVKAANLDLVQQLVGKDNSLVNLRDETGTPPLLYAYQQDKTKIAQFLIFSGADGHVDSNSLLTKAAGAGNQELVEWLLTQGIQLQPDGNAYRAALNGGFQTIANLLKSPNPKNHGILQVETENALKKDDWKSIRNNIELGLPIDRRFFDGNTLLFYALKAAKIDEVDYLLKKGASTAITNNAGETPLLLTAQNFDLFMLIAKTGADLNVDKGKFLELASRNGSLAIVKELLRRGIKMNVEGSALKEALKYNHLDVADELLASDKRNKTFLELRLPSARAANDWSTIKKLVENGLNPSSKDDQGNSLLHEAVKQKKLDIAAFLLKNKAEPNTPNKAGLTPLLLARSIALIQLFEKAKVDIHSNNDALLVANAREGLLDVVKYLVNKNALVGPDNTAIFAAYENDHEDVGDFLAEAFPNKLPPEEKIALALRKIDKPQLELFKKQGFNFSTPVKREKALVRPLWFAIKADSPDLVALLLKLGVNPNQPVKTEGSGLAEMTFYPIHLAAALGNKEIVKQLVENPSNKSLVANPGQVFSVQQNTTNTSITARDIAIAREWKEIIDYLAALKAPATGSSSEAVAKALALIL